MAAFRTSITRKVIALTVAVCVDLSLFYAVGFGVKTQSAYGNLARLWVVAALRGAAVTVVSLLILGPLKPLLIRYIVAHSLLAAVFETGDNALSGGHEQRRLADLHYWLMCAAASLAAALFWEISLPDRDGEAVGREKEKQKVLFLRVLRLYTPDWPLLLGASVFLTLAVFCKL